MRNFTILFVSVFLVVLNASSVEAAKRYRREEGATAAKKVRQGAHALSLHGLSLIKNLGRNPRDNIFQCVISFLSPAPLAQPSEKGTLLQIAARERLSRERLYSLYNAIVKATKNIKQGKEVHILPSSSAGSFGCLNQPMGIIFSYLTIKDVGNMLIADPRFLRTEYKPICPR